mgnify:FL=1
MGQIFHWLNPIQTKTAQTLEKSDDESIIKIWCYNKTFNIYKKLLT